jgi:O-antigen biosynthesis protein WbqP
MYKHLKRLIDFTFSIILLIFLFPIFFVIMISIFLIDGMPILFKQKRVGLNNNAFTIYKFRTLKRNAPSELPTSDFKDFNKYLSKTGYLLRRTYLDEIPQFINILIGDMSLIGPRPLLWNQFKLINQRELDKSNLVKPGLSGLAQISKSAKNNDLEKLRLDKVYVENFSFVQDFNIFIKTIIFVIYSFIIDCEIS